MHHININNAGFETYVKLVSGMIMLGEQPYFWKTLFASCLVAFLGFFLVRGAESKKYARSVTGMISSSISLAISLLIVYNVVFLSQCNIFEKEVNLLILKSKLKCNIK